MRKLTMMVLALTIPLTATAAESPWGTFDVLRAGIAPTLSNGELARTKNKLSASASEFQNLLVANARGPRGKCADFVKLTVRALRDLNATLPKFTDVDAANPDRTNVFARSRLLFSLPSLITLEQLFRTAHEGGYGTLDRRPERECSYVDRAAVARRFQTLVAELEMFRQETLGTPGLMTLEQLTDQLLVFADQQEVTHSRWTWGILGATVVTSVVVGWFAPGIIALTFNTGKGVSRLAAYALAVGENTAYFVGERLTNPEPEQRDRPLTPSYDEIVRDVEALLDASFEEPQLYLAYLTHMQGKIAGLLGMWVQTNLATVQRAVPK